MTQSTAKTTSIADAMAEALERLRRSDERQQQLTQQLLRETRELLALLDG